MKPGSTERAVSVDRVARVVVVVATGWFLFTAVWGMFGIPGAGHIGAGSAANIMGAEQIVRWKIPYPAYDWYSGVPPTKDSYYCHHPFGQAYFAAIFIWLFGHRDFVVHLPAVLLSAPVPTLLYGIARERWGAAAGAVAAAAYVVVPIAVGFSSFTNLESFCIFGALLFFWGHSRHMTTGKPRHMVASLVGLWFACSGDWVGYLLVTPTLAWAFLRAAVLPAGWTPPFRGGPYVRWWSLSVVMMGGTLVLWLALFHHAKKLDEWVMVGVARGGGSLATLGWVLRSRRDWIDFSFTPLAILIGKIALPICLVRVVLLRRDEETYAPGLLFGAVIQYVVFRRGADIHIFWPHYFAPYYALALAQCADTIGAAGRWLAGRAASGGTRVASVTALAAGLMPSVAMAHDGVLSLWVWRRTGGRYDDDGNLIRSQIEMLTVLEQVVLPQTVRGTPICAHESAGWGWEHTWKYQGLAQPCGMPSLQGAVAATTPFWIARASNMSAGLQKSVAAAARVRIYGDTWLVDQREAIAPLEAYSLNEKEPNAVQWLLFGGTEPLRDVGRQQDAWLTWEWRTHLGQTGLPPTLQPKTLDEVRIAHNAAVAIGDDARVDLWRARILGELDRTAEARFDRGVHLIGVRITRGVEPRIESWFEVAAPLGDLSLEVRSRVEARSLFSLIPADTTDREMAWPPSLPTKFWRERFIYKIDVVMNHRIGRERYWARWISNDGSSAPARIDGALGTSLAVVP